MKDVVIHCDFQLVANQLTSENAARQPKDGGLHETVPKVIQRGSTLHTLKGSFGQGLYF